MRILTLLCPAALTVLAGCGGTTTIAPPPPAKTIVDIQVSGAPVKVFDHSTDQQQPYNIPDAQITAWREADGTVNMTLPSFENYRMRGADLEHLVIDPHEIYSSETSGYQVPESDYDYAHWLLAPYTLDGRTIYAVTHSEWYACLLDSDCNAVVGGSGDASLNSWVATPNEMISTNGGEDWQMDGAGSAHTVAPLGYYWTGSVAEQSQAYLYALNHTGVFQPSRVIAENGYYYAVAFYIHRDWSQLNPALNVYEAPVDNSGYILMRTNDITAPGSWQIWEGGTSFAPIRTGTVQTFAPMQNGSALNAAPPQIIYDKIAACYILVFTLYGGNNAVYYMTSKSLAAPQWSASTTIDGTATLVTDPGGPVTGFNDANYVSILDDDSPGYNFEFTTGSPQLFFNTSPAQYGGNNLERDVYRLPLTIHYQ